MPQDQAKPLRGVPASPPPGLAQDAGAIRQSVKGQLVSELQGRLAKELLEVREELARTRYDHAAVAAERDVLAARVAELLARIDDLAAQSALQRAEATAQLDTLRRGASEREVQLQALGRDRDELRVRLERITQHRMFRLWLRWRRLLKRPGL